jgi:hypothetical protein
VKGGNERKQELGRKEGSRGESRRRQEGEGRRGSGEKFLLYLYLSAENDSNLRPLVAKEAHSPLRLQYS